MKYKTYSRSPIWMLIFIVDQFQIASTTPEGSCKSETRASSSTQENQSSQRIYNIENVTGAKGPKKSIFLSNVQTLPFVEFNNMKFRIEYEEPAENDEVFKNALFKRGETEEILKTAMKGLTELLNNNANLTVPLDNAAWLTRFLRARSYDVEKTYELIKNYYSFHAKNMNDLVLSHEAPIFATGLLSMMPKRDSAKRRILIMRMENFDPQHIKGTDVVKLSVYVNEAMSYEPITQITGFIMIVDLKGFRLSFLRQFTPNIAKKMLDYLQNCSTTELQELHLINQPAPIVFDVALNTAKTFMSTDTKNKIKSHKNLESLHASIDVSCLPDKYGGTFSLPEIPIHEWQEMLKYGEKEFEALKSYGIKEKKKKKNKSTSKNKEKVSLE